MINYASNRAGVHMFLAAVVAVAACRGDTRARPARNIPVAAGLRFIRITVTPASIDAPTPTLAPTVRPGFTAEQPVGPVFPDWLDPELNDERPEDDVVFEWWLDYLANTYIEYSWGDRRADAINFRDEGTLAGADGEIDERFLWDLPRTSSLSTLKLEALCANGRPYARNCNSPSFQQIEISCYAHRLR